MCLFSLGHCNSHKVFLWKYYGYGHISLLYNIWFICVNWESVFRNGLIPVTSRAFPLGHGSYSWRVNPRMFTLGWVLGKSTEPSISVALAKLLECHYTLGRRLYFLKFWLWPFLINDSRNLFAYTRKVELCIRNGKLLISLYFLTPSIAFQLCDSRCFEGSIR